MKQSSLFIPSLRFKALNCDIVAILSCHWENGQFRLDCESLIKMSAPQRAAWIGALVLCFWFSFQSRDLKTGQLLERSQNRPIWCTWYQLKAALQALLKGGIVGKRIKNVQQPLAGAGYGDIYDCVSLLLLKPDENRHCRLHRNSWKIQL